MTFEIDTSGVDVAAAALRDADELLEPIAGDAIADLAAVTHAAIRREAGRHRVTGELVDRVEIRDKRTAGFASTATVRAGGIVAPRIIKGQAPHTIRTRRARALAFGAPAVSFAAAVRHPGTSPDPFVAKGARAADIDGSTDRTAAAAAERIAQAAGG